MPGAAFEAVSVGALDDREYDELLGVFVELEEYVNAHALGGVLELALVLAQLVLHPRAQVTLSSHVLAIGPTEHEEPDEPARGVSGGAVDAREADSGPHRLRDSFDRETRWRIDALVNDYNDEFQAMQRVPWGSKSDQELRAWVDYTHRRMAAILAELGAYLRDRW